MITKREERLELVVFSASMGNGFGNVSYRMTKMPMHHDFAKFVHESIWL